MTDTKHDTDTETDTESDRRVTDVVVDALGNSLEGPREPRVIDEHDGQIVILPAALFDDAELPDVDLRPYAVEKADGRARVPIPRHLPDAYAGGLHVVAPEHVAMMWSDMRAEQLRQEVQLREEHDMSVPPIARQRLEREVYR